MNAVIGIANGALLIGVAAALIYRYVKSRQRGFLWLAIPLVLFPLLSAPIAYWTVASVNSLSTGQTGTSFPFSLVESGRMSLDTLTAMLDGLIRILKSVFLLVGILMLRRPRPTES